jgi:hypothetical protein
MVRHPQRLLDETDAGLLEIRVAVACEALQSFGLRVGEAQR